MVQRRFGFDGCARFFVLFAFAVTTGWGQRETSNDGRYGKLIGSLTNYAHGIAGRVYAVSDEVLFVRGFQYDGTGPDAFFWVGNSSKMPSPQGIIVPYPTSYSGREPNVLSRYDGEDVLLKLPRGIKVRDLKWISVWCRRFTVDFGSLIFPGSIDPPTPKKLAEFKRLGHGLRSGPVTILDDKTFYIPNLHYDGAAPDAFFWVGTGPEPNPQGIKVPNELGSLEVLRGYQGEDIEIQLPGDLTVHDIDWLGVWCISFRENFGHVVIPKDLSDVPPALGQNKLTTEPPPVEAASESSALAPTEFDSCIQLLNGRMQVQWDAVVDGVVIRLSAKMDESEYAAFGLSGAEGRTLMIGGDVTVAWLDATTGKFHADDYILSAKSQCDGSRGVCPDERVGGQNGVTLLGGRRRDGVTTVVFQRSQMAQNDGLDKEIPAIGRVNVIAAIGPLNSRNEANYHSIRTGPQEDHRIDFTSRGVDQCPTLLAPLDDGRDADGSAPGPAQPTPTTENPYPPWKPSIIQDAKVFTARIGPAGGKRGYTGITGQASWGIAWYINDLLIPEIYVERGQTYTFIVQGGNDPTNSARYHPLYITDSSEGGFGQKTENEQRQQNVYAGVAYDSKQFPYPTSAGPLCEWTVKTTDKWAESATFEEYQSSLVLACEPGQSVNLTWTVPMDAPKTLYYQCYSHNALGWKINVENPGFRASPAVSPTPALGVAFSLVVALVTLARS